MKQRNPLPTFNYPLKSSVSVPFQDAQHFGDAPGLGKTAARAVRLVGSEDLADLADCSVAQMRLKALEKARDLVTAIRIDAPVGIDERPDQPGPHGSLVVSKVT